MRKVFSRSKSNLKEDEDKNRNELFGSRAKANAPAPQTLAPPGATASPYVTNQYSGQSNPYANQGAGRGNAPNVGGSNANPKSYPANGAGGYKEPTTYGGGMNRSNTQTTYDSNREELFGGRQQQMLQQQPPPQDTYSGADQTGAGAYAQSNGYAQQQSSAPRREYNKVDDPYNTGESRQMTSAEEEDEDVDALKQELRFVKQESLASTQNALRAAEQAEQTGRDTLLRLGQQGEKLDNTGVNLALAKNHGRIAEAKAKELKTLNRSMFAVHVANPFNSQKRAEEKEVAILRQRQNDRDERDHLRKDAYESQQRVGNALGGAPGQPGGAPRQKMSLAEKSKYQFEANESDDEIEDQIDDNLVKIGDAASRLKQLALATNKEVDAHNKKIGKLIDDSERVDNQIALNTHRLKRFGA